MGTGPLNPEDLSEEQLRAAYEQEIKRVRVEHVLLENVVTIINLGMRRTGMMPGTEDERDPGQVQLAIESVRALLPQIQQVAPEQIEPIMQAVSQLQMAFVQSTGAQSGGAVPGGPQPGDPPPGGPPPGAPTAPAAGTQPPTAPPAAGPPPAGSPAPEPGAPESGQPGPAQQSGRLWIPGQ